MTGLAKIPADWSNLEERTGALESELARLRTQLRRDRCEDAVALVCFSGDWDRVYAAFTLANGALALGQQVHMFFTFWGTTAVRQRRKTRPRGSWFQRLLGRKLPADASDLPLSKFNFGGFGKVLMNRVMKAEGMEDLPALVEQARELGAQFHYCDTSLQMFGWEKEDLVDGDAARLCGVSTFLSIALRAKTVLFI